jgi:hypothetical protein
VRCGQQIQALSQARGASSNVVPMRRRALKSKGIEARG